MSVSAIATTRRIPPAQVYFASDACPASSSPACATRVSCIIRHCIAVISDSIATSFACTSWKLAIGLPNCCRVRL